eukprot:CAMPEP_0168726116 /NCGR_PEP_ID=MMETSP0724-20121128/4505_1 /TAXON_ID=265536 /ORGANISM="Amphiprora sp., Strain CCMP467" /LENGTH=212 /DNA_ID=CAMNT_0008772925 /DNA_START=30 /DNA_END=668 /DNA_ORIENTATION=+
MMKVLAFILAASVAQAWSPAPLDSKSTRRGFLEQSIATTAGAVAMVGNAESASAVPAVGAKAPAFELPSSRGDGSATSLSNLVNSGKWTVLYFYPGAFTSGCTLEAKYFQRDLEQYRTFNAQIVGVSVDPPEKNAQFCSSVGLDFFMLSDIGGAVSKLYGSALSIPGFGSFSNRQTYLIDPKGNIRWVFTDVESRIPTHSKEVLDKLAELTA